MALPPRVLAEKDLPESIFMLSRAFLHRKLGVNITLKGFHRVELYTLSLKPQQAGTQLLSIQRPLAVVWGQETRVLVSALSLTVVGTLSKSSPSRLLLSSLHENFSKAHSLRNV